MAKEEKKEKVYISRDEGNNKIWIWKKPKKGNWKPTKLKDCEIVVWQREDIDNVDCYLAKDFRKKFSMNINTKTCRCDHLPINLLNNEDYKLFSNDPDRKK